MGTGASATYGTAYDNTKGGYARIATEIKEIRSEKAAENRPVILVDSGDFLMGTVYDMSLGDVPLAMAFMNYMKYNAITIGNHEFDYGPGALASFFNAAGGVDGSGFTVPVIASNMITSDTDPADDGIEALQSSGVIKETLLLTLSNGLKLGIIGLLGKGADEDAPLTPPLTFRN